MMSNVYFEFSKSPFTLVLYLLLILISFFCFILYKLYVEGVVPTGVPWAGVEGDTFLCQLRSTILASCGLRELLLQEYAKERPFLVATLMDGPIVVLPHSHSRWYKSQKSKGTIDFPLLQTEKLHLAYFPIINTEIDTQKSLNLIHRLLTKSYVTNLPDVNDEAKRCFDALLGNDTGEWKKIPLFHMIEIIMSASANRMMIGTPLCQNETYLDSARTSGKLMFPLAVIVQCTPSILRPIVGRIEKLYLDYHFNVMSRHVAPMTQRLLREGSSMDEEPPTLLTRYIQEARKTPASADLLTVPGLQAVIGAVNLAALASTSINCTDILLNILSYEDSAALIEQLRREAKMFLASDMGVEALDSMPIMESVCRESLRLENGDAFFVEGVVTQPLTTPSELVLPRGTKVALPLYCIHRDPKIYPEDPMSFHPYRFVSNDTATKYPAYEVSENYMPFSFGPKACPGRWFAIAQIKIVLSRLLIDYDVKSFDQKPEPLRFGGYSVPSMKATISVRKRKE